MIVTLQHREDGLLPGFNALLTCRTHANASDTPERKSNSWDRGQTCLLLPGTADGDGSLVPSVGSTMPVGHLIPKAHVMTSPAWPFLPSCEADGSMRLSETIVQEAL